VVSHPNSDAAVYLARIARKLLDGSGPGRNARAPRAATPAGFAARRPTA